MSKTRKKSTNSNTLSRGYNLEPYFGLIVFILAITIYASTVTFDYTQDDAIVITNNTLTKSGVTGIADIFSKDSFFGYFNDESKANLVSGGRYRPLTIAMFAIEYQLFGLNPFIGHLINILLYGLLGFMLLKLLKSILIDVHSNYIFLSLIITLIYVVHPVHTEAVANIKGRDEIMAMLGGVSAFYFIIKYLDSKNIIHLLLSFTCFLLGLFSKENTITFLAIIPLGVVLFKFNKTLKPYLGILAAACIFLIIRFSILGFESHDAPRELMNNPFLKWDGNKYIDFSAGEKASTIIYTLGKYIQLCIWPFPLTHDYYPRHIDVMSFSNWKVLLSLGSIIALGASAILNIKKHKTYSFGILFFFLSLSIVSNVFFPIGTNMSERFLFMPSLGLIISVVYILDKFLSRKFFTATGISIIFIYSILTLIRIPTWKDNYTLFTTDVVTSNNSAKILNAAGGAIVDRYNLTDNKNTLELDKAIGYLDKASQIHPTYKIPYLIKGNAQFYQGQYINANKSYRMALTLDQNYTEAYDNLALSLRELGKAKGEKEGDLDGAIKYLSESVAINNNDGDTWRLLGVSWGVKGDHQKAIENFKMARQIMPQNASIYLNLGKAYEYIGNEENARLNFDKALELDPNTSK